MKNKIEDLRNHLFETLEALKDKENPMDIQRARAIAEVAGVIVDSAMVECKYAEIIGGAPGTTFLPAPVPASDQDGQPKPRLVAQNGERK